MADWSGVPFLRLLWSEDFFRDFATLTGSFDLNTFDLRSRASLVCVTLADQRLAGFLPRLAVAGLSPSVSLVLAVLLIILLLSNCVPRWPLHTYIRGTELAHHFIGAYLVSGRKYINIKQNIYETLQPANRGCICCIETAR
jgi:hypothetical protein